MELAILPVVVAVLSGLGVGRVAARRVRVALTLAVMPAPLWLHVYASRGPPAPPGEVPHTALYGAGMMLLAVVWLAGFGGGWWLGARMRSRGSR